MLRATPCFALFSYAKRPSRLSFLCACFSVHGSGTVGLELLADVDDEGVCCSVNSKPTTSKLAVTRLFRVGLAETLLSCTAVLARAVVRTGHRSSR